MVDYYDLNYDFSCNSLSDSIVNRYIGIMKNKYVSYWNQTLQQSQKLSFYCTIKDDYSPSPYLVLTRKNPSRKALVRFRISGHQLRIETVSWTITQPIELTITRFPSLFRFNPTHKLSRNSMKKNSKENSRSPNFFDSSSSSLLSTHVLITLFGSPSPNLVVLINVTKLGGVGLVNLSYTTPLKIVARNFYNQT